MRWPLRPPHLTLKPSPKSKTRKKIIRRVWGQVRRPFGPPDLTLKPSKKNNNRNKRTDETKTNKTKKEMKKKKHKKHNKMPPKNELFSYQPNFF